MPLRPRHPRFDVPQIRHHVMVGGGAAQHLPARPGPEFSERVLKGRRGLGSGGLAIPGHGVGGLHLLRERDFRGPTRLGEGRSVWLGKLACCGYCLGHWIAFGLVVNYRPRLFEAWWLSDYVLTALVIAWLAAFRWVALCWLMEKAGK